MKLIHHRSTDCFNLTGHGPGFVLLNGERVEASMILTPERCQRVWAPSFQALTSQHFAQILEFDPELVLVGTGRQFHFPAPQLTQCLHNAGLGVEVMDTAAACRTFIVLASEGRRVVAGLILP